jgi:hypothetical protein
LAIDKVKCHKSPGIDQIPAELIKAGVGQFALRSININSIWNKKELPEEWKESIILPIYKKGVKTEHSIYRSISLLSTMCKFYPTSCCQVELQVERRLLGTISVDFDATCQLLIIYSTFVKYMRKNGNTMQQCISYL